MISQFCHHSWRSILTRFRLQRPHRPAEVVTVHREERDRDEPTSPSRSNTSSAPSAHFRLRSVPLCRSTNAVLILWLTPDLTNTASTAAAVPKITCVTTSTTRPFFRVLCTVANAAPPAPPVRLPRPPRLAGPRRHHLGTERLQDRPLIGRILVGRDQLRSPAAQSLLDVGDQLSDRLPRPLPGTTETTSRCSGSNATWSQQSP